MGKTYRNKINRREKVVSYKMKFEMRTKRKTLKNETNPRVLKLASTDEWNYS